MFASPMRSILCAAALASLYSSALHAQAPGNPTAGPDPREIPLPAINTPLGTMPGVKDLPVRAAAPDIFTFNDGRKVKTLADWKRRREEMRKTLAYYATGQMPPAPGNVRGEELHSETLLGGKVKYRLVKLTFGPDRKLELNIGIFTPTDAKGPMPAIISQASTPPGAPELPKSAQGPNQGKGEDVLMMVGIPEGTPKPVMRARPAMTAEQIAQGRSDVFERGYALVIYNDNDCAEDTTLREPDGSWTFRHTRFMAAYPNYDWGVLAGWAWGASRVADYLETQPEIDKGKLIITGASRSGKAALIAAAFDDRLMGAPVVTGGGGNGLYRMAGADGSESLDIMEKKYPNWFSPHLHEFWGQREKLPFDEHWLIALAAPKPFIALEGDADVISLPPAVQASIEAARPVYKLYGEPESYLGIHYSHHPHAFTTEDWTAMMDFADITLRHMKSDKQFNTYLTMDQRHAALKAVPPAKPRTGGDQGPPQQ